MKQSLLFDGCCKLAFQVELVQWCLDKARLVSERDGNINSVSTILNRNVGLLFIVCFTIIGVL